MKKTSILKITLGITLFLLAWIIFATKPSARAENAANWPLIQIQLKAEGFQRPVFITHGNDGSGRLFIVEQAGLIRILNADGSLEVTPFLDITSRVRSPANGGGSEEGLLSASFPPDYTKKGHFYAYYTNQDGNNLVVRYSLTDDPNRADPSSEQEIIFLKHPIQSNHNGGQLAFGKDGYLYIGTGDGGGGGDPNGNAQNPASLLGKILRIDVEYSTPNGEFATYLPCLQKGEGQGQSTTYSIPPDNPYINQPGYRLEIWALGLRNPWRFSFDRQTYDLYIGDVGQGEYEEVDFQPANSPGGENYGWNIMEASQCYNSSTCNTTGLVLPVAEYDHSLGCSITGGYVYRGLAFSAMQGIYFYADFCSGKVWGLQNDGNWQIQELLESGLKVSTFGESESGELYLADLASGNIYQLTTSTR